MRTPTMQCASAPILYAGAAPMAAGGDDSDLSLLPSEGAHFLLVGSEAALSSAGGNVGDAEEGSRT